MKQKLLSSFRLRVVMLVAILCSAFAGHVWAQNTATLEITKGVTEAGDLTDSGNNTWAFTTDGKLTSNSKYIQAGTNSASVSYIRLVTTAFSTKKITKIQVWGTSKANTNVTVKVIIGSTTIGTSSAYTSQNASSGGTEFSVDNTNEVTGNLTIEISRPSSATGAIYFNKAVVTYDDVTSSVATTTAIDASGITNTNVYTSTAAGTLAASVTAGGSAVAGATVTWSGNNDAVATINENTGAVTLVSAGTVTFTASYAGVEDEYQASSATYVMNVTNTDPNAPGSENNPYTVAQALAANTGEGFYVKGIVSTITEVSTSFHNATYKISDDGSTTSEMIIYRGKYLDNTDFTSEDQIQKGDEVIVYGNITQYQNVNQFAQGNYLVSLKRKEAATITVEGGTEFTINRENDEEELTLSATANSGATVTFSVDATNSTLIEDDDFLFENSTLTMYSDKGGVVVIKANAPAAGDYKAATEVTITVTVLGKKIDAIIVVQDDNVAYGQTYTVDATMIEGGDITLTSSNENVATVNGLVITPVAVGTTTITVVTAENAQYKAGRETFTLTVNAPEGQTTAAANTSTVFEETFAESTGTSGWSGNAASGTIDYDNDGWQSYKASGNDGSAKFGTSSAKGYAITPAFGVAGDLTLRFKSGAWNGDKTDGGLVLSVEEGEGTLSSTTFNLTDSEWSNYEVSISGATAGTKIKFSAAQASKNRFFLDDVVVTTTGASITATLNGSGYATFCSEYPLDFTNATGYSAWQITDISSENVITFSQVKGSVKGGTGLLLKGEAGATITLTSVNSTNELGGNFLEGTLAPTYVEANKYYGLSGDKFVKVKAGTVKAGKALLNADWITEGSSARQITFIFEDDNTTTGISEELRVKSEESFYNLNGQRVNDLKKSGLYIMNGKKVIVK